MTPPLHPKLPLFLHHLQTLSSSGHHQRDATKNAHGHCDSPSYASYLSVCLSTYMSEWMDWLFNQFLSLLETNLPFLEGKVLSFSRDLRPSTETCGVYSNLSTERRAQQKCWAHMIRSVLTKLACRAINQHITCKTLRLLRSGLTVEGRDLSGLSERVGVSDQCVVWTAVLELFVLVGGFLAVELS